MEYDEFELQLGPVLGERLHVRVLRSPAGAGESLVPLLPILDLAPGLPRSNPATAGTALFQALFKAEIGELFHASLRGIGDDSGMRLRLRINPRDSALAPLHGIPWELLFRKATEDFLALSRWTPVVRAFDIPRPAALRPFAPPLRLLAVSGAQDPLHPDLDLPGELDELEAILRPNPEIEVQPLENPEPRGLRHALTRKPYHALHFMGHGVFDPLNGEGALLCRDPAGGRVLLSGRHLATKLKDLGSLRLVVLNACDTAVVSADPGHNPFAGVATALVLGGVPAVVAMQSPIDDPYALAFSAAFYDRLAHGLPIEEAVAEGRQAIHSLSPEGAEWAVPVLFLRTPTGDLFRSGGRAAAHEVPALRWRGTWAGLAAGAVVAALTVAVALPRMTDSEKQTGEQELDQRPHQIGPAANESAADDTAALPRSPSPTPAAPQATSPPTATRKSSTTRSVTVGEGHEVLRFQLTADRRIVDVLAEALRQAGEPLPRVGISGQTVRINVRAPRIESSTEAGLPSITCTLSATGQLENGSFTLPSVVREQGDEDRACALAAEVLAQAIADRLASSS